MIGEVFRFELGYRLRQPSTWIYAAVLLIVPFLMPHAVNGASQLLNSPDAVTNISAILGGFGMLVSAGLFGDPAARDVQSRMYALFYTSPLRERDYLLGRFLAAALINAILLIGVPLGQLIASLMPYMPAGKFGPVMLAPYAQVYVLMLLPNMVLIGACMFAAAALMRRSIGTYAGGLALYVLGMIAEKLTDGFANLTLSAMADPFGGNALITVRRFWTPAERNVRLIGFPPLMLWNRALWLGVAILVLAFVAHRFRFEQPSNVRKRAWWRRKLVIDTAPERLVALDAPRVVGTHRSFGFGARVRQTMAVAARAWREIAATRAFLVILVGALFFVFAYGWDVGTERFGTSTWPVTQLIAGTVLSAAIGPVMAVLIAIFAGELVWRERDAGMADIAGVAPVPDGVALLGRFVAFVGMIVVLQLVLAGAGMLLQALRGYHHYEPLVYLELLFGVKLADYVLLAVLAMTIHVIVNSKFIGHLVVVLYFASMMASGALGLRHRMLVYGSDPGWVWSDFNGLAPFMEGLVWFKLYWAAWALVLAVLASLFWVRGRETGVTRRLGLARQRLVGNTLGVAAVAVVLVLSLGGFVFYNTNVVNGYASRTPEAREARQAEYERRYKRYDDAPQPSLTAVQQRVDLYPAQSALEIRGTYRFVNHTAQPIDSLHVPLHPEAQMRAVSFDRPSRLVVDDSTLRYRIYALERPIAPGDSIAMTFDVAFTPRGFRNSGAPTDVTENGVYLDRSWFPMLGYQSRREIADSAKRREYGLPPRVAPPSAGDVDTRSARDVERVSIETTIGTDSAQTAITPGALVREWREGARRYFTYRTDAPTSFGGAVFSGKFAVREARWGDIPVRVYYHPTHDVNVDRMLKSMQASLAYYSKAFGPYQFRELRVVEFPLYASFARGHPHTIAFSEGSAFLTRVDSGEVDRTYFVVAHETAHQWWGGQVIPAGALGAAMVSETLAQYSSMMVLETAYGRDMARKFYDYNLGEYLRGRTVFTNREAPLLDVERQNYVYYYKGAVAMYTLRERLGADVVNGALRRFRDAYAGPDAPPPTSRALYAELQAVTPDSLKPLLSDLFEHITLWEMRTDSARAERASDGTYRVTLHVTAAKVRADSVGHQTPTPMDEPVEIGVFADTTAGVSGPGPALYLAQHRIHTGAQTITVTVPRLPTRAGIDPYRKFIERERDDNVVAVQVKRGA